MKARFSDRSIVQLTGIRDYIARESPSTAELVRLRVIAAIKRLESFPDMGHAGRKAGTRELRVAGLPLIIVYSADGALIILGVFHAAQDR